MIVEHVFDRSIDQRVEVKGQVRTQKVTSCSFVHGNRLEQTQHRVDLVRDLFRQTRLRQMWINLNDLLMLKSTSWLSKFTQTKYLN